MINIAICDDESNCVEHLCSLVEKYKQEEELCVYTFTNASQLMLSITEGQKYQIVFIDIEMPGMLGTQAAKTIKMQQPESIIIFVTAFVSYVSETFRLGAFQFLLKPVQESDFAIDFARAIKKYHIAQRRYDFVRNNEHYVLRFNQIYYLEQYQGIISVMTKDNTIDSSYRFPGTLQCEELKLKHSCFVRCHSSFLINLNKVIQHNHKQVILDNKAVIPLGRKYKADFLLRLNKFISDSH